MDKNLEGTLIDGSDEMLKNAKERLKSYPQMEFIQETFQDLVKNNLNNKYDLLHHL